MIDEKLSLYFQQINLVKKKLYNAHSNKKSVQIMKQSK